MKATNKLEQAFVEQLEKSFELFKKKNNDYGSKNLGEFMALGVIIRASDKMARLKQFYFENKDLMVEEETVIDTWSDLVNYAVVGLIMAKGQWTDD